MLRDLQHVGVTTVRSTPPMRVTQQSVHHRSPLPYPPLLPPPPPFALNQGPGLIENLSIYMCEHAAAMTSKAEHDSASDFHRNAGSVVVSRHRGNGCVSVDYLMQFNDFNTFVADVKLSGGFFYFEVTVVKCTGVMQFGVCTHGFEGRERTMNKGVGDDSWSWAVDGSRQYKWHDCAKESFGTTWATGDVIGFALDMRSVDAAALSVSVNGSRAAPNGVAFRDIAAPYLSPAFTGHGQYCVNFGDRPFAHAPHGLGFMSVHDANKVILFCNYFLRSFLCS
jgi:hypothetical protein